MKTYVLEGTMTALSSVSHIGETRGITSLLRREKIAQPDNTVEEIPVVSGNSLRGIFRDAGMMHMLQVLGYGVDPSSGMIDGVPLSAFYFLFSGGALTKSSRGIDVDEARRWRELIPLVALFGGAMGNQIMPGKMKIGKLYPICNETAHIIPERFEPLCNTSVWELCQQEAYTRRDDEKNENLRFLISGQDQLLLQAERKGEIEKPDHKQQMRYFVETLCAGSMFFWDVTLLDVSDVEFEAFLTTMTQWGRAPYIGGKSGTGHGKVQLHLDKWLTIDTRVKPTGTELDVVLGEKYLQHIRANGEEIREILNRHVG